MLLIALLLITTGVVGQSPSEDGIHPWLYDEYCFIDYYLTHEEGICELCPKNGLDVTEEDCRLRVASKNLTNATVVELDTGECTTSCIRPQEGQACNSDDNPCEEGVFFCNYEENEQDLLPTTNDEENDEEQNAIRTGTCQACFSNVTECITDASILTPFGREDCASSCDLRCIPLHYSVVQEEGEELEDGTSSIVVESRNSTESTSSTTTALVEIDSQALYGSISKMASGPLVKCTNLIFDGETTCDDDQDDINVEGSICLAEDYTLNTNYLEVTQKCAALGGVAVILFGDMSHHTPNNQSWAGSLSYQTPSIPAVTISYDDGKRLEQEKLGSMVQVNTSDVGEACFKRMFCSDQVPCLGTSEGQYCDYKWSDNAGFCRDCPKDENGTDQPLACFFTMGSDVARVVDQKGVESCSATCTSTLTFPTCKFCPEDVSGFDFGIESDADRCAFCAENDIQYPDREFPLFGEGVQCWQVQKFFETVEVSSDAINCRLARMMNYVCGCKGPGYVFEEEGCSTTGSPLCNSSS